MSTDDRKISALDPALFSTLFDATQEAVLLLVEGRIIDCNPAACRFYDLPHIRLLGLSLEQLAPERQPNGRTSAELLQEAQARASQTQPACVDWQALRGGRILDCQLLLSAVPGRRGPLLLARLRDQSRQRAEERHRLRADSLNSNIVRTAPVGILVLDANARVELINPAMRRMLGLHEDLGQPGSAIEEIPVLLEQVGRPLLEQVLEGDTPQRMELRVSTPGCDPCWLDLFLQQHLDEDRQALGVVVIAHDVSLTRRLEDQLRQSQKMQAIGTLAGGIAHDFNNLLTGISGNVDLALMPGRSTTEILEQLKEIRQISGRAADLTRRLLIFSRRQIADPVVLRMDLVLYDLEKMLRRLIGENIEMLIPPAESLWTIRADQAQMEQVILNLVVNARDAMPGGGQLSIGLRNVIQQTQLRSELGDLPAGEYVELEVCDTGCGIDTQSLHRIFEPFYTTKAEGQGTGLGLAMVYSIVSQHHGLIQVDSATGKGSRFRVLIPRIRATAKQQKDGDTSRVPHGSETVLLVEDELAVRELTRRILRQLGYEVLAARDGADALSLLEHCDHRPDLLITDVVMPQLSGPELVANLRARWPQLRVLYISGYSAEELRRLRLLEDTAADYLLRKPFSMFALAGKVRDLLEG